MGNANCNGGFRKAKSKTLGKEQQKDLRLVHLRELAKHSYTGNSHVANTDTRRPNTLAGGCCEGRESRSTEYATTADGAIAKHLPKNPRVSGMRMFNELVIEGASPKRISCQAWPKTPHLLTPAYIFQPPSVKTILYTRVITNDDRNAHFPTIFLPGRSFTTPFTATPMHTATNSPSQWRKGVA